MGGRLLFPLCRSCCEETQKTACNHENVSDREFSGTWVVDELRKAIELGYTITEIQIIWQHEVTRFDRVEGGLFVEYVTTFLKIKQEASGWHKWCTDAASKARYFREYERAEGIVLDCDKIEYNPGLRALAKLCLYSFRGKFGQRSNLMQTEIVKTREALLRLLACRDKEVYGILPVTDDILYVTWRFRKEVVPPSACTNSVIVAYTTAQAGLDL